MSTFSVPPKPPFLEKPTKDVRSNPFPPFPFPFHDRVSCSNLGRGGLKSDAAGLKMSEIMQNKLVYKKGVGGLR